jgi:hypothetical protein
MSMLSGSGTGTPQSFCGFCGFTDTQPFTYCPRCGRPASTSGALAPNISQSLPSAPTVPGASETFGEASTNVRTYPYEAEAPFQAPAAPGAWPPPAGFGGAPAGYPNRYASGGLYPQGYPAAFGASSGVVGASAAPLPPARARWSRRRRLTVISGGVLAFLIVASAAAYFVYTAFFAFNQTDSARYLPSNTIFYTSLDLQQISQNPHQVSLNDVAGTINSGLEQSTGLNFQNDVQPWLGRGFTYALVSITQQPGGEGIGPQPGAGTVYLISTRDTNASNASLQKAITTQEQKYHVTFTSISYGGVTLQSDVDSAQSQGDGATPLVLGIVKDQVVIASTVAVAEQVIDRANGSSDTLAKNSTFTDAVGKLPSSRFGTLYVNVSELLRQEFGLSSSVTQNYPVGYGSLQFTDQGLRLSFTLETKTGTQAGQYTGNTNASAGVVPASTLLYAGLGNLGGFFKNLESLSGGIVTDDEFQQTVGLPPDDPLLNAPASLALLPPQAGSDDAVDPLVLLHFNIDPASANAKVQQAVENLGYDSSSTTIDGVTVTEIDASQTVYYAILGHDLVFSYDTDGLTQAIATAQGKQQSLAQSATFQQLANSEGQSNALTVFISLENIAKAPGPLGDAYRQALGSDTSLLSRTTASYLVYSSDASGITITEDIALK